MNADIFNGLVVDDKQDKTVVALTALEGGDLVKVHDESNQSRVGDQIKFIETGRISRTKAHTLSGMEMK